MFEGLLADGGIILSIYFQHLTSPEIREAAERDTLILLPVGQTKEPAGEESYRFVEEAFKRGVQFGHAKYAGMGNVVKIKPPLVITETEAERVMEDFEQVTQLLSP